MTDPDGLERLWTPHRMAYVRGEEDEPDPERPECPFCRITPDPASSSDDELVVARGTTAYVVLNLYPYNPGHLMVLPYRHVADYTELDDAETLELAELTKRALVTVREVSQPHAFNVGLNLGGVAGGSLSGHLHQHVVPRWSGDANFMTVVAGTKTLPQLLGGDPRPPRPGLAGVASTLVLERFRDFWTRFWSPVAHLLIRLGVTPNMVTLVGTLGVSTAALVFFPRGELLVGVLVITAFVFSDLMDGYMARLTGKTSKFGAFWDSTLDRIGDGAIFGGLALYFAGDGDSYLYLCVTLWCLVMGSVTSYARARAESLGMDAKGGIAERSDRLVSILVMTGLSDIFDLPELMYVTLWALAAASTYTVVFRIVKVYRQAVAADAASAPGSEDAGDAGRA
ncbi:phosphatidylinositol phosphate synthase [Nocardioides sp. TF02-7]|uniref:phosphatidylinositol phosphate synthase n=1 Tax=Nocardioides sp. TF02-7 TaxID=2917724 RepID=UPI0031F56925